MLASYPFFPGDYIRKTLDLTSDQHAAYFLLLLYIYSSGKRIPSKKRYIIAKATNPRQKKEVDFVLKKFFIFEKNCWANLRAEQIISKQYLSYEKRVAAGIASGEARASKALESEDKSPTTEIKAKPKNEKKPQLYLTQEELDILIEEKAPDYVSKEMFKSFCDHRIANKHKVSKQIFKNLLSNLSRLKDSGEDANECIERSITNGWRSFFPKGNQPKSNGTYINKDFDKEEDYLEGCEGFGGSKNWDKMMDGVDE